MTHILRTLLLLCLLPGPLAAEEFEPALERLVQELRDARGEAVASQPVVAALIALPRDEAQRAQVLAALEPVLFGKSQDGWSSRSEAQGPATDVLAGLGATPELVKVLIDPDSSGGLRASNHLSALGPQVIPALWAEVPKLDLSQSHLVSRTLIRLGAQAVPSLRAALGNSNAEVRSVAVWTLPELDKNAAPLLIEALRSDPDPGVRRLAASALTHRDLYSSEALTALLEALEGEPDGPARLGIATTIGHLGVDGEPALPRLFALYRSAEGEAAETYARALSNIGKNLRRRVGARWWALALEAYPGPSLLLLVFLLAWYPLAPRYKPHGLSQGALLAKTLVIAGVPAALSAALTHHAITQPWAKAFLPETWKLTPGVITSGAALATGLLGWIAARWKVHPPGAELPAEPAASP